MTDPHATVRRAAAEATQPTGIPYLDAIYDRCDRGEEAFVYYRFLFRLAQHIPGTLVELGVSHGWASLHWLKGGGMRALGVDIASRFDWRALCMLPFTQVIADSTSAKAVKAARRLGGIDVVFIDTDHTYEQTRREYSTWRPLVRPGGLMLFDDILWPGYGCTRFWAEIAGTVDAVTLPELHTGGYGFGVVFVPHGGDFATQTS